jgi:hypothetical protein
LQCKNSGKRIAPVASAAFLDSFSGAMRHLPLIPDALEERRARRRTAVVPIAADPIEAGR